MKASYFIEQIVLKILLIWFTRLFFKIEIVGRENLRQLRGPLIITPNHKSYIDHFLIGAALPFNLKLFPIRAMVHKEQMDRPIVGFCVKMLGGFTARTKGKNLDELFDMPLKILKNHGTILIYPEGRINEDAKINPIMTGAAELGLRVSAKYLPVAINGLDYFSLRDIHKLFFVRRKIQISFGQVYSPNMFEKRKDLTVRIKNEIEKLYDPYYNKAFNHPS